MELNRKKSILECARKIFCEKGLTSTTFRDIALDLNISDGHVRYYFKSKEELLLTLFHQFDKEILTYSMGNPQPEEVRNLLKESLRHSFGVIERYSFFFYESPKTIGQFPELNKQYKALYSQRSLLFMSMFTNFRDRGIFRKDLNDEDFTRLFDSFFILSDSWIRFHLIMKSEKFSERDLDYYSDLLVNILNPYFE